MEVFLQYIDDTKLDHFYTQVSRRSDRRTYSLPENQPMRDLLPELINFLRAPHKTGDACLQLQGPDTQRYLDMDCTLKEHVEDFGVRITKQDTFLIKTKLSILISLLKDKMEQCASGGDTRTLRTILKHMPDIIDEDSDFAPELLRQRGLSFLRSLTERDSYSNFDRRKVTTIVLNVLLKIVSYVDGMLAVYRDRSSVAWLYSQVKICSEARNPDGRNTAIAILYIFVDSELETEAGLEGAPGTHDLAVLLVKCAQEIHLRAGTAPFSEFLDILSEKTAADPETVLAVIQLINKTLETLKDADEMDYFDDLVSALLEQGLNKIMEKQKQGKSAKNKLVQEYNKFVKLLRMEYEEGSGDLDSILKSCMERRPSYQPGSVSSGSEDNLLALDRKKRSSLSHNPVSSRQNDNRAEKSRSLTPDIRIETPRRSKEVEKGRASVGDRLITPDWKRKDFSYSPGLTSTPNTETDTHKESLSPKQKRPDRYTPAGDSYTPGTYRSLQNDSGYQSPAPKPEPTEQIFSPYDRHRKVYYEKNAGESSGEPIARRHPYSRPEPSGAKDAPKTELSRKVSRDFVPNSLESRYSARSNSREDSVSSLESRYSPKPVSNNVSSLESRFSTKPKEETVHSLESRYLLKPVSSSNSSLESRHSSNTTSTSSEENPTSPNPNSRLTVKSHPYQKRDTLPSPDGPPRKLDSPFSSFTRTSGKSSYSVNRSGNSVNKFEYTGNKHVSSVSKPENSVNKPENSVSKPENSVNKPENSVNKPENSVSKPENSVNKPEKNVNIPDTKSSSPNNINKQEQPSSARGKLDTEKNSAGKLENRWKRVEPKDKAETNADPNTNKFENRSRGSRRLQPDADQVIRALQDAQDSRSPSQESSSPSQDDAPAPYALYKSAAQTQKPRPLAHSYSQAAKQESEDGPGKLPLTCVRSLKERRIALALSSTDSMSVDVKEQEATPVNIPQRADSAEKSPLPEPGRLAGPARQGMDAGQTDAPSSRPSEPLDLPIPESAAPPKAGRLGMADTGCDLAPSSLLTDRTDVFIFPFSPELNLAPSELRLPELQVPTAPEAAASALLKQKSQTLPPSAPPSAASSAPPSPTEESPLAKQLLAKKQESDVGKALIPLPEVNLARHELTFGQVEFRLLDSKYDKDPYQGSAPAKTRHVPGTIPPPPPDLPRCREIPAPPPDMPEVRGGSGVAAKLSSIRFRWKLLGKDKGEKRDIWSELRRVVAPSEVIKAFVNVPSATPPPTKSAKPKETMVEILNMKRRTSLGVTLKRLHKFKMGEEDNFRKLRGYMETLDLEVLNEEIIEVLEKDVLTKGFAKELEDIRREKQEALSQGNRIKLREEEKFLLALGEVESLTERIDIATFCLRFHEREEELAKKLMVLMGAAAEVKESHTFKFVLSTLLSIGNAVEQREAGGFDLEFLERAESYKDACHKKDLIHHAAVYVMENFPQSSNLYSDFPNVHDAWRMELEFSDLKAEIMKEQEKWSRCKTVLDKLKLPTQDSFTQKLEQFGLKINKFYITLGRMENYYRDLYLYLGYGKYLADSQKLFSFLKVLHNFSLFYKSHHERIIQIREKMEQEKRRQRTRGVKLAIAESIQVKMELEAEGAPSGAEDEGTGVANRAISAVIAQRSREVRKPKTGVRYREKKAHGNRREKRTSIRRTLNEEDGLIDLAKKELETEKNEQETAAN